MGRVRYRIKHDEFFPLEKITFISMSYHKKLSLKEKEFMFIGKIVGLHSLTKKKCIHYDKWTKNDNFGHSARMGRGRRIGIIAHRARINYYIDCLPDSISKT